MPEIIARSCCSKYFATSQPRLTVPTTWDFGTRTLSKKVSQNGDRPEIKRSGLVETPFDAMSNRIKLIPSCFLAVASVRTRQKIQSAKLAYEVQIFWPLMTKSSPSLSARVCNEARSDPAFGSE